MAPDGTGSAVSSERALSDLGYKQLPLGLIILLARKVTHRSLALAQPE